MPCFRRPVRDPGQQFGFKIVGATNLLTATGVLSTTQPSQRMFTEAQLRHGIGWVLVTGMTYVLTILAIPADPSQETLIDFEVSFDANVQTVTCKNQGAGVIAEWVITVR